MRRPIRYQSQADTLPLWRDLHFSGGRVLVRKRGRGWVVATLAALLPLHCFGQAMPATAGEMMSGKKIVLADEGGGHAAVLVAGFSREGGNGTGAWVKAIHSDPLISGFAVYQVAMIAGAPSLIRGMIKSGMK